MIMTKFLNNMENKVHECSISLQLYFNWLMKSQDMNKSSNDRTIIISKAYFLARFGCD